jgi:tRNA A37 methylthiotransferase MiaB
MNDDVERAVKKARKVAVDELQQEIQGKNNAILFGKRFDVLVEGRKRGRLHGRSRGDRLIYLNVPDGLGVPEPQVGDTVSVEITDSSPWSLEAELPVVQAPDERGQVKKEKVPVV